MKRAVSVFCACILMLMLVSVGYADGGFQLRNGIQFGDTIETIVEKETTLQRTSETSNEFEGTIAGYSGASCLFGFDDDGHMKSMKYSFDHCTSRDSTNEVYKKLYQSLVRQYGSAKGNTGGACELIMGPAIGSMALYVYVLGEFEGYSADYYDYDEWIIDTDEYHVKIDLVSYYYRDSDYKYTYYVDLSYYMYTDEEYQEALDEKRQERNDVDNDL